MSPGKGPPPVAATRYFFSIRFGERLLLDREGIRLSPEADLVACARFLADRLLREGSIERRALAKCSVEVTSEDGTLHVREAVSPP